MLYQYVHAPPGRFVRMTTMEMYTGAWRMSRLPVASARSAGEGRGGRRGRRGPPRPRRAEVAGGADRRAGAVGPGRGAAPAVVEGQTERVYL